MQSELARVKCVFRVRQGRKKPDVFRFFSIRTLVYVGAKSTLAGARLLDKANVGCGAQVNGMD